MSLDPRHLSLFLEVVRAGSFSAAAERRNLTQPAVSMAIAQLERRLDACLLERTRAGVILTPLGALVLRRAEAVEHQVVAAEAEVKARQAGVAGPFNVGGTPGALVSMIPDGLRRLSSRFPNLALHIREGSDAELLDLLRAGKVDVALGTTHVDAPPPDVVEIDICADDFVVVSRPGGCLAGSTVALQALADQHWVLAAERGAFRRQIEALFLAADLPMPLNVVRCDSLATTKEIVRTTDYITLLPQRVVAMDVRIAALQACELKQQPLRRWIGLRTLKISSSAPMVKAFAEALAEALS